MRQRRPSRRRLPEPDRPHRRRALNFPHSAPSPKRNTPRQLAAGVCAFVSFECFASACRRDGWSSRTGWEARHRDAQRADPKADIIGRDDLQSDLPLALAVANALLLTAAARPGVEVPSDSPAAMPYRGGTTARVWRTLEMRSLGRCYADPDFSTFCGPATTLRRAVRALPLSGPLCSTYASE